MILLANTLAENAVVFLAGVLVCYIIFRSREKHLRSACALKEKTLLENTRRETESLSREARLDAAAESLKLRQEAEQCFTERRKELSEMEARLNERELLLNKQLENLVQEEQRLRERSGEFEEKSAGLERVRAELASVLAQRRSELATLSKLSEAEARSLLLKEIEQQALQDSSRVSRRIIEEARLRAEEKARHIISLAMQRYAASQAYEHSSATVTLPSEEIKGRIIGREGRNIRAFEAATGVTVLIDDTPNAVVLSGFDPVRREIAREAMQRLLLDGRIHPTRIEEVVAQVSQEMDDTILRAGEDAIIRAGIAPVHPEIMKLLGRLRFRHSFSQNILEHSIEVAHFTGLLAGELGADVELAKRAGLFHDIGKAVDHEVEGPHALAGAEILRRCGEPAEVVSGVASHHDEAPQNGVYGILVSAADAISAARPGARSETMTTYIKRVEDLEQIGNSFPGVEKCYAVQAGRELRVIVRPDKVNDTDAFSLSRNIARRIEEELQYPGQIRVVVVRETRSTEFAK